MNWGSPEFVLIIIALSTSGWLVNNWIRARHGYALEDEWGGKTARSDEEGAIKALRAENDVLRQQLQTVQDRLANVERIVTDSSYGLTEQIEALRLVEGRAQ
jgi:ABC-type phosphate transport system auxiliary subunit